jgi:hypothetical protein
LFGYDKGAFTGAVSNKPGLFELAHGGTLFLDEIGEMELTVQSKLLKVIEDMRFRRLGGIQEKAVDVRVIAASNRDLVKEVKAKKFRDDLFYRLNVMPIHVPPLRELQEDILPMSEHFLRSIAQKLGKPISGFSSSAQKAILNYGRSWTRRQPPSTAVQAERRGPGTRFPGSPGGTTYPSRTGGLREQPQPGRRNPRHHQNHPLQQDPQVPYSRLRPRPLSKHLLFNSLTQQAYLFVEQSVRRIDVQFRDSSHGVGEAGSSS